MKNPFRKKQSQAQVKTESIVAKLAALQLRESKFYKEYFDTAARLEKNEPPGNMWFEMEKSESVFYYCEGKRGIIKKEWLNENVPKSKKRDYEPALWFSSYEPVRDFQSNLRL